MQRFLLAAGALLLAVPALAQSAWTDMPGRTITAGGTSQQLSPANSYRRAWYVQNPCFATESVWLDFGVAATMGAPSVELRPCGSYRELERPSAQALTIIAATAGHAVTAKEQ